MTIQQTRRGFMGAAATAALAGAVPKTAFAKNDPLAQIDAVGQAKLVKDKKVSPLELVDATIARIEAMNPKTNAVVTEFFDKARTRAKSALPAGPLAGVPYLIKDLNDVTGERTTSGSRLMDKNIANSNGLLTQKALDAGMIILGKTNTPEFGLTATTESIELGPCHNPWNLEHSTGGSSGGAAAAVASGMLPVAHASDGGGSIRIPASSCGVFGMKPSRGRMNFAEKEKMAGDIAVENCVSRTVRDNAMMFSISEDASANAPLKPVGFVTQQLNRKLKIAISTLGDTGQEPHPDVKAAVQATAKLCQTLGHEVTEARPKIDGPRFQDAFLTVWAEGGFQLVQLAKSFKLKPEDVLEPWTIGLGEFFAEKPKDAMAKALTYFKEIEATVDAFFAAHDAWLTPVLSSPAPKLGFLSPTLPFQTHYDRVTAYAAYTPIHNVAGTPAMSVPLGMSKDGLPIGSQFSSRKGNEGLLYALAYQLEAAQPWVNRHAPNYAT